MVRAAFSGYRRVFENRLMNMNDKSVAGLYTTNRWTLQGQQASSQSKTRCRERREWCHKLDTPERAGRIGLYCKTMRVRPSTPPVESRIIGFTPRGNPTEWISSFMELWLVLIFTSRSLKDSHSEYCKPVTEDVPRSVDSAAGPMATQHEDPLLTV